MSSLYNIENKYHYIMQGLEANEGELTPELEEELVINEKDFKDKVANYRAMIVKWKADVQAAKQEKVRIDTFKKNRENAIKRLSNNLDVAFKSRGMSGLDMGVKGKISYRKSKSVSVDETLLAKKWFTKKVTEVPNKTAIGDALKAGTKIKGAELVEKDNIQIK